MNKHRFAFRLTLIPLLALFLFINVTVQANESTHQEETGGQKRLVDDKPQALVENPADLALPKELASLFGLPEQEVEKWGRAIEALHTGAASRYSEQLLELFQKLSTLSDTQIDMFLSGDSPVSPGLRKTLEAVKYFGAKGIRDLEELGSGQTPLLGQVARSVLERKKADRAFLERARMIREGLTGLNTRLGQQKPNRAEMGELADARMSLRASVDQLLDQSGRHPESKEAIQAYRDALEAEKRILEHHRKIAVDRSQPTYWGNLGTELKRSYLSLDGAHRALGAVGMIPFLGEAADLIDGSLYLAEGKKLDASLSFAAMVPVAGIVVTAGRQTVRATRAVAGVGDAALDLGRAARTTAHNVDAVANVGDAARASTRSVELAADVGDAIRASERSFEATADTASPATKTSKPRKSLGRDGGVADYIVERNARGEVISKTQIVTVEGKVVHQSQDHLGKYGSERRFPDEWIDYPEINDPHYVPKGPRLERTR